MLNALFAPPPAASSAAAKSHVGAVASANDEDAANGFRQKLDQANAQPPKGPEARPRDKVRGPLRGASGNEPAKAEPVPKAVPSQVGGKDRRTVPPEGEGDGERDGKLEGGVDGNGDGNSPGKSIDNSTGNVDVEGDGGRDRKGAAVEPTSVPGVTALLAELRAATPAASGAARRGGDVGATLGQTPASALAVDGAPARTQRGEPGGESAQEGSAGGQRDSFAQQLSAAAAQDAGALRADSLSTATNPLLTAAMTAAATHSAHASIQASVQASAQANIGMPTEAQLTATPGSAQFGAQLGAQISTFVQGGIEHARLHLNPAEMGPVSVQIQIDGQTARVNLSAENAHTRQALEQALPHLAGSLREAGLTLSGGGVFEQPRQGGGAQTGSGPGSRSDGGPGGGSQNGSRGDDAQRNRADDGLRAAGSATPARRRGVVDLVA